MEVKFQNTYFAYNHRDNLILDSINFKIQPEKVTGIIGTVGSGKTTLLDLISGVKVPTKGKVIVGDITLSRRSSIDDLKKLNVGYLTQTPEEQFYSDTVRNDLYNYLEELDREILDLNSKISEVFKMLNLDEELLDRDPFSLSHGELRLVLFALLLICDFKVLLLDEPTAGLDNVKKQTLVNVLTKIKKIYSKTIIIVSNDIDFINKVSDNIAVIKSGKVIKSETKSEIFKDVNFFINNQIPIPQIMLFKDVVLKEKRIRLPFRDEINDLVKDILRNL